MRDVSDFRAVGAERVATGVVANLMGTVLGLVGFAFVFTTVGAVAGIRLGPAVMGPSAIGGLIVLVGLLVARNVSPLNLILLYAFSVCEGLLLGPVLDAYAASGMGGIVVDAAGTTAAITVAAGAYGALTRRDLSGMRSVLFVGLIAVVVGYLLGLILHLSMLSLVLSAISALLFTAYIVYDFNRVARTRSASQGDAVLLAVSIYLDILNLFLSLLRILSAFSR
jgi:modulator of FtsH protease